MATLRDFLGKTETIAATTAGQVPTFDKGVPAGPFKRFNFLVVGANNSLAGTAIDEYRVKLGSNLIWQLTPAQFRAFLEAMISPIGGSVPATSSLRYTMPFDLYVNGSDIGLPAGYSVTVEISVNVNSSAGSVQLGWEMSNVPVKRYVKMIREQMNAPASSASGYPYYIKTGKGIDVLGFILPLVSATQGIQEIWVFRSPDDKKPAEELGHWVYSDILESQAHYNPEAITNPFFWKPFATPIDYPEGSYLKVKTGSSSAETDEIVPVQLIPVA